MLDVAAALAKVAAGSAPVAESPAPEPETAPAPEAPAPAPEEKAELTKSDFADIIDRLEKGDFGNTDAAHGDGGVGAGNNEFDKSTPMGTQSKLTAGVIDEDDAQQDVDGANKRVKASVDRSRGAATPPPPTNLDKSESADEDEDDLVKAEDQLDAEDIFEELVEGEGAEAYAPVAEGSWAIQYLTDTFAKAISHLSGQFAALSVESHERYDLIEKSQAALRDATVLLLKSAQRTAAEPMAKSMLATAPAAVPASGVVVIVGGDKDKTETKTMSKGALRKSITDAMNDERIDGNVGGNILARLDSQDPAAVWANISESNREKILAK